jgi:hypothetical protein
MNVGLNFVFMFYLSVVHTVASWKKTCFFGTNHIGFDPMQANRRFFLTSTALSLVGFFLPKRCFSVGAASQIELAQLIYPDGNWCPRPTALRRLAWEIHKRCSVDTALEPAEVKAHTKSLSRTPLVFLSGDRPFSAWSESQVLALRRFIHLGGTLVIDPAHTPGGDPAGFESSVNRIIADALPKNPVQSIPASHVLFRAFYQVERPVGRILGPAQISGVFLGERLAVIYSHHDLGGAWARDNLGNWEFAVEPGGERQRETAFRLGINIVMYALCLDYKNEEPHRRFGREME